MDKRKDLQIALNIELRKENEELKELIKSREDEYNKKLKELNNLILELDSIKKEWTSSIDKLNEQRNKYSELNKELLNIKKKFDKVKKYM